MTQENLKKVTQDPDMNFAFSGGYALCRLFPQELELIESLMRINDAPKQEKRRILGCLGDIYLSQGRENKAEAAYRKALNLPK